jgi:hypothetical protein
MASVAQKNGPSRRKQQRGARRTRYTRKEVELREIPVTLFQKSTLHRPNPVLPNPHRSRWPRLFLIFQDASFCCNKVSLSEFGTNEDMNGAESERTGGF